MKIQTTVIIAVVLSIGFFGVVYVSQLSHDAVVSDSLPLSSNNMATDNKTTQVTTYSTPSEITSSITDNSPITFHFIQNSTTLKVSPGSNVSDKIPIIINEDAPMRFVIDDRNFTNPNVSSTPSGLSVSLLVFGNQYQPEFLSQEKEVRDKDNHVIEPVIGETSVPTKVGETLVEYTISVPKNVSPGKYSVFIDGQSFLQRSPILTGFLVYDESGRSHIEAAWKNQTGLLYGHGEQYTVNLTVE
jgi:hypothetical protein